MLFVWCMCGRDRCGMPWCRYELNGTGKSLERLSMIAGGTGITPMYQVRTAPHMLRSHVARP